MFAENCYIASLPGRADCVVIDPGLEPARILSVMRDAGLEPAAILCTHGHADHIAGNAALKKAFPSAPLIIGEGDAEKLADPELNLSGMFSAPLVSPPADRLVRDGDTIQAAGMSFQVRETPGHSSGHVVFITQDQQPCVVFGGDVLFHGSVGRTDFPDGDAEQLYTAIREKLFTLPADTQVYPGHGEPTTIGVEMESNPYVGRHSLASHPPGRGPG
ncbi:MAG: MBL fold metallo-hydrolase [Pirellulaceae bacterium]|nr:MBL fold metallo-hydrolase [Pirellulaceae bacterium]